MAVEPEHLLEYDKLKNEQAVRITARDSLLNYNVVALAALATIGFGVKDGSVVLVIAPWLAAVFGWSYVQHEQKISSIGRYLRATYGASFQWESGPKHLALGKRFHELVTLMILLLAFVLPCFVAPSIWLHANERVGPLEVALVAIDFGLGACLAVVLIRSVGR